MSWNYSCGDLPRPMPAGIWRWRRQTGLLRTRLLPQKPPTPCGSERKLHARLMFSSLSSLADEFHRGGGALLNDFMVSSWRPLGADSDGGGGFVERFHGEYYIHFISVFNAVEKEYYAGGLRACHCSSGATCSPKAVIWSWNSPRVRLEKRRWSTFAPSSHADSSSSAMASGVPLREAAGVSSSGGSPI